MPIIMAIANTRKKIIVHKIVSSDEPESRRLPEEANKTRLLCGVRAINTRPG